MTTPPVLPDVDALVTAALRAGLPRGVAVRVLWPDDWPKLLPLVVVRRVGGTAVDPIGLDAAVIDMQCAAPTRREASALARTARVVLLGACRAQFAGEGGYLSHGEDQGGPFEVRDQDPAAGPDLFRFLATFRVTARPH
ncbi:hypothetical protein [Streptomyces radicis]|uniref:DUF3168 domain-containing protein n=1 Tax=Streptomyces radicis TaxID=1750517 RepID=A0A3A9WB96_9ACTN|nr:hypothetical protein [Streptomyces radicis]RKN09643.1 hypothetical protein D7319_11305 [Streptomyces radicis]